MITDKQKDINFYRKEYLTGNNIKFPFLCPDLFEEYFNLLLANFYKKQREILTVHFDEKTQFNKFIGLEIENTNESIKDAKEWLKAHSKRQWPIRQNAISILEAYVDFLNNKILPGVKSENHLPLDYYALLAFYEWEKFKVGKFTRESAERFVKDKEVPYTFDSLYNYFRKWANDEFRLKNPSYKGKTDKKLKEKIELFDKVAAGLPKDGKRLILLEIDSLTNRLKVVKLK
jgi:hypothetical protein